METTGISMREQDHKEEGSLLVKEEIRVLDNQTTAEHILAITMKHLNHNPGTI